jgi:hypothetical protein
MLVFIQVFHLTQFLYHHCVIFTFISLLQQKKEIQYFYIGFIMEKLDEVISQQQNG